MNMSSRPTDVSIILPAYNDIHLLGPQIQSLESQKLYPLEVIIVDSSSNNEIKTAISQLNTPLNIVYLKPGNGYKFDRLLKRLSHIFKLSEILGHLPQGRLYPPEAINHGVLHAKANNIALLDMATKPSSDWLESYLSEIQSGRDIVFGTTKYSSNSSVQKCIHFSTYGEKAHETNPGTMVKKDFYLRNKMLEGFRAGFDLEWRQRIKAKTDKHATPKKTFLIYDSLPHKFLQFLYKMFSYQMHAAPLEIQQNSKNVVGIIFLILASLIVTRWNYLVGWESDYYIPHITKLILIAVNLFLIQLIILRKVGAKFITAFDAQATNYAALLFFSISFVYLSFRWNAVVAGWIESSRLYIPHLTKLSIIFLFTLLIIFRGLFFPLRNGVSKKDLFPVYFIKVGLYGALADIAKLPGFLLGAISYPFIGLKKNETK